jgi:hypothetical protein
VITPPEVETATIFPPEAGPASVGHVDVGRSKTVVPPVPNEGSSQPEPANAIPTPSPAAKGTCGGRAAHDPAAAVQCPVEGVVFRPTRPVPHEDGFLTEVARASWDMMADRPVTQVHVTTTFAGRIRAWGLHQGALRPRELAGPAVTL